MTNKVFFSKVCAVMIAVFMLSGCAEKENKAIIFATSADYPPFEYYQGDTLQGFDIDLARAIAQEIGKEAKFENMKFHAIFAALQNASVDAAISTITMTEGRKKTFDFSRAYHEESLSLLYPKRTPLKDVASFKHKKIACQISTIMEIWLRKHAPNTELVLLDDNTQAIEALKAGHVDGVLVDSAQASSFVRKNPELAATFIAKPESGYVIAVKKGSELKDEINRALDALEQKGELDRLRKKWLEHPDWKH